MLVVNTNRTSAHFFDFLQDKTIEHKWVNFLNFKAKTNKTQKYGFMPHANDHTYKGPHNSKYVHRR